MHPSTRFRLVALGLVAVFGLALVAAPAPVAAGKPVTGGGSDAGTAPLGIDCGSFEVLDRNTIEWTTQTFFDQSGTEIRFAEQVWGTDTFINSVTGAEYPTTFHNSVQVDRSTGLGPPPASSSGSRCPARAPSSWTSAGSWRTDPAPS